MARTARRRCAAAGGAGDRGARRSARARAERRLRRPCSRALRSRADRPGVLRRRCRRGRRAACAAARARAGARAALARRSAPRELPGARSSCSRRRATSAPASVSRQRASGRRRRAQRRERQRQPDGERSRRRMTRPGSASRPPQGSRSLERSHAARVDRLRCAAMSPLRPADSLRRASDVSSTRSCSAASGASTSRLRVAALEACGARSVRAVLAWRVRCAPRRRRRLGLMLGSGGAGTTGRSRPRARPGLRRVRRWPAPGSSGALGACALERRARRVPVAAVVLGVAPGAATYSVTIAPRGELSPPARLLRDDEPGRARARSRTERSRPGASPARRTACAASPAGAPT